MPTESQEAIMSGSADDETMLSFYLLNTDKITIDKDRDLCYHTMVEFTTDRNIRDGLIQIRPSPEDIKQVNEFCRDTGLDVSSTIEDDVDKSNSSDKT